MVDLYHVLLFIHVAAVIVWLGARFALQIDVARLPRAVGEADVRQALTRSAWMAQRIFMPASAIVIVFGFAAAAKGSWDLADFWIAAALVGFVISAAIGMAYMGPESLRLQALLTERGGADAEIRERFARFRTVGWIEVAVLGLVVFDMTTKPFL